MKRVIQKLEEEQQKANGNKRREHRTGEQETDEPMKKNQTENQDLCCIQELIRYAASSWNERTTWTMFCISLLRGLEKKFDSCFLC